MSQTSEHKGPGRPPSGRYSLEIRQYWRDAKKGKIEGIEK